MHHTPIGLLAAALLAGAPHAHAGEGAGGENERFSRGSVHAGLSVGWGQGFEPDAHDQDEVRMLAVVPRIGVGLTDPLGGDSWYRGSFDLSLEPQLLVNFEPEDGLAGGAAVFVRYHFLTPTRRRLVPFVGAGAGMLALDFDGENQDDGFNFVLQAGAGAHFLLGERMALTLDARWHHISNAGLRSPNKGIDSGLFLLGVTRFFE